METNEQKKARIEDEEKRLTEYCHEINEEYKDEELKALFSHERGMYIVTFFKMSEGEEDNVITELKAVDYYGFVGICDAVHQWLEMNYKIDRVYPTETMIKDFRSKTTSNYEEKEINMLCDEIYSKYGKIINCNIIHPTYGSAYFTIHIEDINGNDEVLTSGKASEVAWMLKKLNKKPW